MGSHGPSVRLIPRCKRFPAVLCWERRNSSESRIACRCNDPGLSGVVRDETHTIWRNFRIRAGRSHFNLLAGPPAAVATVAAAS